MVKHPTLTVYQNWGPKFAALPQIVKSTPCSTPFPRNEKLVPVSSWTLDFQSDTLPLPPPPPPRWKWSHFQLGLQICEVQICKRTLTPPPTRNREVVIFNQDYRFAKQCFTPPSPKWNVVIFSFAKWCFAAVCAPLMTPRRPEIVSLTIAFLFAFLKHSQPRIFLEILQA